ncbi:MAG: alkene reductase [Myxococcota bacterium]
MSTQPLLAPYTLGDLPLPNRMVMAPMTRSRAGAGRVPTAITATYYAQRASAGLIVTEGTQVSEQGIGYVRTPGIHTEAQIAGWRDVTDAVHAAGGRIFAQLWHVGRASHSSFQPGGDAPVAPSPIRIEGQTWTERGQEPFSEPRALGIAEIPGVVAQFAHAARAARDAGFDGVELHGANGYLIDQFLRDGANHRTDAYGGPVANRARFLLELVEAVTGVWPNERVGVRLSPTGTFNGMSDSDPRALFAHVGRALDGKVVYVHLVEPAKDEPVFARIFREAFGGALILNGGYDRDAGNRALADRAGDLVAYGVPFLANPDLVRRFADGLGLNRPDPARFYTPGPEGYIDYPQAG